MKQLQLNDRSSMKKAMQIRNFTLQHAIMQKASYITIQKQYFKYTLMPIISFYRDKKHKKKSTSIF